MMLPKLQFACDHSDLAAALKDAKRVGDAVDILEAGTVLLLQEGRKAIQCLRAMFPEKCISADPKCADAGGVVAKNVSSAGADVMTVICAASLDTMKAAAAWVGEIQIELFGDWTFAQAEEWKKAGITQVIYHQSRDGAAAKKGWGASDLEKVKRLAAMGFRVSVTGGITVDSLALFEGIPVYAFIVGRAISGQQDPWQAALDFQTEIKRIWGKSLRDTE